MNYEGRRKFQSSPKLSAGCKLSLNLSSPGGKPTEVSILTQPILAGCSLALQAGIGCSPCSGFNPHPTFRLGARCGIHPIPTALTFQSSPNRSAGCSLIFPAASYVRSCRCFNPHPTYWLGATRGQTPAYGNSSPEVSILTQPLGLAQVVGQPAFAGPELASVSILTQPLGWVQRVAVAIVLDLRVKVSILARPLGWLQACRSLLGHAVVSILTQPLLCFNSHLTYRLGAAGAGYTGQSPEVRVFQSSPNLSAGCSTIRRWRWAYALRIGRVSILIQPLGWVQ